MKSGKILLICFCLLFFFIQAKAQKDPMRFGKPDDKVVLAEKDEKFPDAEAVVLCDYGKTFFSFGSKYLEIRHQHESQIKIQSKDAYHHAEIEIPIYSIESDGETYEEEITGIKGYTHNAVNGEIERFKLDKDDIFTEEKEDGLRIVKFTLPNVKPGSVIEYKYEIRTPQEMIWIYRGWRFQSSIPTRWSEFRAEYLQATIFQPSARGYHPFVVNEGPTRAVNNQSKLYVFSRRWAVEDAPGLQPDEGFVTSPSDYLTQIRFRLTRIQFPGQKVRTFSQTWEEMNSELLENKKFGGFLKEDKNFFEIMSEITEGAESKEEQIKLIHKELCSRVDTDLSGGFRKLESNRLLKDYKEKKLSASEANMIMVRMLKAAGYESDPVLVSTRSNGKISIVSADASDFNYVLCAYKTGDGFLFLDAADTLLPTAMVSPRCLNGKAFMVSEKPGHVDIKPSATSNRSGVINVIFNEDNKLNAHVEYSLGGYAAYKMRKKLEEKKAEEVVAEDYEEEGKEKPEIEFLSVENLSEKEKPIILKYNKVFEESAMSAGDRVYISPLLAYGYEENPFKLEERKFPIDMAYPIQETFIIKIDIPEGYEIEEMPQAQNVALPQNGGRFMYTISQDGNQIQIMSRLDVKKTFFTPEQYIGVKEFFARIVEKQNEQIVLKKKS